MSIEAVFTGTLPDHTSERKALLFLYRQLDKLEDWFALMVRFTLPSGRQPVSGRSVAVRFVYAWP